MEEIRLKAASRPSHSTKKATSDFRVNRQIPAVIYGGKNGNLHVVVGEKDLLAPLKRLGANAIIHLETEKGEETVILKQLQRDEVSGGPVHADFQRVDMKKQIDVQVPVRIIGDAPGVKLQGGLLDTPLRELEIRCLPTQIPQSIDVDVTQLNLSEAIHAGDLKLAEGLELLSDKEAIVVHVIQVRGQDEPEAAPAEGDAAAEPEVIAKGKKDEEGEGDKKDAAKKEGGK